MAGVSYSSSRKKYMARPTIRGKKEFLGYFKTKEEAELAVGLRINEAKFHRSPNEELFKNTAMVRKAAQLEETRSESIFTRVVGRLKRHSF